MEFVAQLWASKSDGFFLGVECNEIIKNHIWLALIVVKTTLVGCSLIHLTNPDFFADYFEKMTTPSFATQDQDGSSIFRGADSDQTSFKFTPACKEDSYL